MKIRDPKSLDLTYNRFGRFTDPQTHIDMLKILPNDVIDLAKIVENQIVHHNLLSYYGVSPKEKRSMKRLTIPQVTEILASLRRISPYDLLNERKVTDRLIGSCLYESHFLSSLLKTKGYQSRQRAGFFKNIRTNQEHIVSFWHNNLRLRENPSYEKDPESFLKSLDEFSQRQNYINARIEHWIVEYFDEENQKWKLLDGNTTFLKVHSDLTVDYNLPKDYYEFSYEAWQRLRYDKSFTPNQYVEDPQDGASHIRSFLLFDFFSLLNHEVAGKYPTQSSDQEFVKEKTFAELSPLELDELDQIANLLAKHGELSELIELYNTSETLKLQEGQNDPYSFLFKNQKK